MKGFRIRLKILAKVQDHTISWTTSFESFQTAVVSRKNCYVLKLHVFPVVCHSSGPDKADIQDGTGKSEILSHLFDVALKLVREEHVKGALGHRVHLFLSAKSIQ